MTTLNNSHVDKVSTDGSQHRGSLKNEIVIEFFSKFQLNWSSAQNFIILNLPYRLIHLSNPLILLP